MILQTCPDLFKYYDMICYDSTNMSKLVQILWHDLIRFYKHVQTCSNITIQFDTIKHVQTCLNILRHNLIHFYKHVQTCSWYYGTIWYDSTNMFKLVQILQYDLTRFLSMSRLVWYDLIRFYKHVQTCSNITIWFDTILKHV